MRTMTGVRKTTRRSGLALATAVLLLPAPDAWAQAAPFGSPELRAAATLFDMTADLTVMTANLPERRAMFAALAGAFPAIDARRPGPPASWAPQDPADSLYCAAREALNRGSSEQAARLFGRVVAEYPDSDYAPDALYWRAFALYRIGDGESLRQALAALERQAADYPDAATRGDAQALTVRIRGALAQRGDADAAANIAEAAGTIAEGSGSCERGDDYEIRVAALNALMHMDESHALPIARRVLERRDACSAELREKAVFVISRMHAPQTADILVDIARNDPSIGVRKQAVFWLSNVDGERTVDAISDILRNSDSQELRESAVFALSRHDSPRAAELLRSIAADGDVGTETREKAIFWLARDDSPENTAFLRSLYGQLRDAELREQTLFAISRTGGEANYNWLLEQALDENAPIELRQKAVFWAGRVDEARIDDLVGLYDRSAHRGMKEQLIFVYSRRDEPQALDKLIQIARDEADIELRKKAVFWLSRSDDPRAVEVLREIINR